MKTVFALAALIANSSLALAGGKGGWGNVGSTLTGGQVSKSKKRCIDLGQGANALLLLVYFPQSRTSRAAMDADATCCTLCASAARRTCPP